MTDNQTDPRETVAVEPTGHPEVDAVLATLDGIADRPVADHVAVFEAAHERLRGALASAGDEPSA